MKYNEILKALIGVPTLSVKIDKPFPLIGEDVTIASTSTWVKQHNYIINEGSKDVESVLNCIIGKSSKTINMVAAGEFVQNISVSNDSGEAAVQKVIRPMGNATEPYFDLSVSKEIIRNDGETTQLILSPENGYSFSRPHTISARVYAENTEESPVVTYDTSNFTASGNNLLSAGFPLDIRGIYDIEVDITDLQTGVTFSKRINKLITVTPKLAPRNEAIEYLMPDAKLDDGRQSWIWDGSNIPAGSTIVLKYDPQYGEKYPMRWRLINFKGTWDKPIIITIDTTEPFEFNWFYYYGIYMDACEHVVFDGRGYNNLKKGFKMIAMPEFSNIAIQAGGLTHELEFFEIEIEKADFSGFMIKTDPDANYPAAWYDNFKFNRLLTHHCYVHDTLGEGMYLGYYGTGWMKGVNSKGEEVNYRAHHLYNCRIYRNDFIDQGYDSFQMNNAEDVEICYNRFINGGLRMEKDQTSGLSISISGKLYNNLICDHFGPGIQFGIMGELEMFNNIICQGDLVSSALYGLCNAEPPAMDGSFLDVDIPIIIHNNILMSYGTLFMCMNTNQWKNVQFYDNFCVYKTGMFGGQAGATMALWKSEGNIEHKISHSPYDYNDLDLTYKFGDSESKDYRIASNSSLVEGGTGKYFKFDFRGYKNWFNKVYPVGPYMGIFKNPNIADSDFELLGIILGDGTPSTLSRTVSVQLSYKGTPTKYRLGEAADLSDVAWLDYTGSISYTLSDGFGLKTIYVQLSNDTADSSVKSSSITYQSSPLALDSIALSGGYNKTVTVTFNYSGSFEPAKYRLGEAANLAGAAWLDYLENIRYVFSTAGEKILYGQLQDGSGNISEIKSASISVVSEGRMAVISMGWPTNHIDNKTSQWDEEMKLTKVNFWGNNDYFWKDGTPAGTIYKIDSIGGQENDYFSSNAGVTTGDNSGRYPDVVLEKFVRYQSSPTGFGYRDAKISIAPGNYKIRLFCSTTNVPDPSKYMKIRTVVDGVDNFFSTTGFTPLNNADVWLEQNITVGESGEFSLQWGLDTPVGWNAMPLNIIEIIEI